MGLGGVLDGFQIVFLGDGFDGVHVCALTVDVHGDDDGGFVGEGFCDAVGVHAVGLGVDVDHDGHAACVDDGFKRGEKSVGWDDGFESG